MAQRHSTPAVIDFAVGKATSQEALAAILHRHEVELDDQVTVSELTASEISWYRLRPDEVKDLRSTCFGRSLDPGPGDSEISCSLLESTRLYAG
jgi:hypothetical protein